MDKTFTLTIVTRKTPEEIEEVKNNILDTCGVEDIIVNFIYNDNNTSLPIIYNEILEKTSTDINVFCHDDIIFKSKNWGNEVLRLFDIHQDYGIIGVAGSKQFDENGAWWNYQKKAGQVLHKANGKAWLTCFSDYSNEEQFDKVCVIDGLFMCVSKSRITQKFDVDFQGFDHYDTSFCLANYKDGETKIGVTNKIHICHKSIGELSEQWQINLQLLNYKYNDIYPIEVR